jgi:hypothetical protein
MLTYYEYAALSKTPHALADGLMLVFEHPDDGRVHGFKDSRVRVECMSPGLSLNPRPLEP